MARKLDIYRDAEVLPGEKMIDILRKEREKREAINVHDKNTLYSR